MPAEDDNATVSFPATEMFARLGRVTVSGLSIRLGLDISRVERLRTAVDIAVGAMAGDGHVTLHAHWHDDFIEITVSNPDVHAENSGGTLTAQLTELVDHALVAPSVITLVLQ